MESYEQFTGRLLAQLRVSAGGDASPDRAAVPTSPSCCSSVYGATVLPPLLTRCRREEIQRCREEALQRCKQRESLPADTRVSQIRTLLDSVQLRGAPTLQEFIQKDTSLQSPNYLSPGDSQDTVVGHWDHSSPFCSTAKPAQPEESSIPQLTSLIANNVFDCPGAEDTSQPTACHTHVSHSQTVESFICPVVVAQNGMSHQSISSGYLTCDNISQTASAMGHVNLESDDGEATVDNLQLSNAAEPVSVLGTASEAATDLDKPYRVSLQNLLKKSQEYRQQQRRLRSAHTRAEIQNLSDKENDEILIEVGTELRKVREKDSHTNVHFSESELNEETATCSGEAEQETMVPQEEPRSNSDILGLDDPSGLCLPSSRDVKEVKLQGVSKLTTQPFYFVSGASVDAAHLDSEKFKTFPSPGLCMSPMHCKKSSWSHRGQAGDACPSELVVDRSVQISQLEINLSTLKALISDLASTLTEGTGDVQEQHASVIPEARCGSIPQQSESAANHHLANRSYNVEVPSELWLKASSPSITVHQGAESKVKRRLVMNTVDKSVQRSPAVTAGSPHTINLKEVASGQERQSYQQKRVRISPSVTEEQQDRQTRVLKELKQGPKLVEQSETPAVRQQQQLMQRVAMRNRRLQQMSFQCATPRLGRKDADISCTLVPPGERSSTSLAFVDYTTSERTFSMDPYHRPLVAAAVKGFLTRRLLHTETVAQLLRTVKDSQQLLQTFQAQTEVSSRQDQVLLQRVWLQLCAAKYEIHDIFFSCSVTERMQMISRDRDLIQERQLKRKENGSSKCRISLSTATQKSLARKKALILQKKAAERQRAAWVRDCWRHPCKGTIPALDGRPR